MPKLIVSEKGTDRKEVVDFSHEGLSIGRSDDNSVKLVGTGISRQHAKVIIAEGNCFLIDLGGGNGTSLNGTTVKPNEKILLRHGDTISIENYNLSFNQLDEMLASSFNEITDSDILEVKLLKKVLRAIDKESIPSLEVLNGSFVGKKIFLSDDVSEVIIGRDESSADFEVKEYVISRQHAKVFRRNNKIFVQDLGSKNGTYINNKRITEAELHDGDRITLGTIVLIYRNPKEVDMEEISRKAKRHKEEIAQPEGPVEEVPEIGEADGIGEEPEESYPTPQAKKERIKLSFFELGLIGFGVLIFILAGISLLNLLV